MTKLALLMVPLLLSSPLMTESACIDHAGKLVADVMSYSKSLGEARTIVLAGDCLENILSRKIIQ